MVETQPADPSPLSKYDLCKFALRVGGGEWSEIRGGIGGKILAVGFKMAA